MFVNVFCFFDEVVVVMVDFVKVGGGLWIICGDIMDEIWFNQRLSDVLSGELRGAKGQALLDNAEVAEVLNISKHTIKTK